MAPKVKNASSTAAGDTPPQEAPISGEKNGFVYFLNEMVLFFKLL